MQFKKNILQGVSAGKVSLTFRRFRRPSVKAGDILETSVGPLAVTRVARTALAKITEGDVRRAGYPTRAALLRELGKQEGDLYRIAFRLRPAATPSPVVASPVQAPKTAHATSPAPDKLISIPAPEKPAPGSPAARIPAPAEPRPAALGQAPMVGRFLGSRRSAPPPAPPADVKLTKTEVKTAIAELGRLDKASGHGAWTITALRLIDKYPARRTPDLAASQRRDIQSFDQEVRKLKELGLAESLEIGYRLSPRGRAVLEKMTEG